MNNALVSTLNIIPKQKFYTKNLLFKSPMLFSTTKNVSRESVTRLKDLSNYSIRKESKENNKKK